MIVALTLLFAGAFAPAIQDDVADVPNKDSLAGGDKDKRYFMIGPMKKSDAKSPLLLVLPGGPGSADFNPFVRRIVKNALPSSMVVAQLVAPVWSPEQPKSIVWPTKVNKWDGMKFSTEDFIESVIKDVSSKVKIDPSKVFALVWSSSGPAIYSTILSGKSALKGAFVAMSIFNNGLAPAPKAKGTRFYILHSPDDFIPIDQAELASDLIPAWGGEVKYQTYAGGHGWHGDVFGNIRAGVDWLLR